MNSNEKELYEQINLVTVYSNITELTKLNKLEDLYRKIIKLKKNRNEHQRLKYKLTSIAALNPKFDIDKHRFIEIELSIVQSLEIYLLQQFNELKRLNFRLHHQLPKLLQGQLQKELRCAHEKLSKINEIHEEQIQKICDFE